jgi:hypothetical protein
MAQYNRSGAAPIDYSTVADEIPEHGIEPGSAQLVKQIVSVPSTDENGRVITNLHWGVIYEICPHLYLPNTKRIES